MNYSPKGELTSSSAVIKIPPEDSYQRQDDLGQTFLNGQMIKQGEVVRNPTTGDYEYQLAARDYYSADDRLMAVQKYSWRPAGVRDGTWEEYRYDALGRRIMTRARRDTTGSYLSSSRSSSAAASTYPISFDSDLASCVTLVTSSRVD
jgi:YD repeat-containing protein